MPTCTLRILERPPGISRLRSSRFSVVQGNDGDLPLLELDYMNAPLDEYTGMHWGDSNRLWYGWLNEEQSEPERAEKARHGQQSCLENMQCSYCLVIGSGHRSTVLHLPL